MIQAPAKVIFNVHSAPAMPSHVDITAVNRVTQETTTVSVDLEPTLNWTLNSTKENSHAVELPVTIALEHTNLAASKIAFETDYDITITAEGSNILICGYAVECNLPVGWFTIKGIFDIKNQPVWDSGSEHYAYDDHVSVGGQPPLYPGPSSLIVDAGDKVSFSGVIRTAFLDPKTT
jgi:hypothetical protein